MDEESLGRLENRRRDRFTLELRDDIVGRFLLQLPQKKRPDFVRRLLEESIKSGEAYDIADDYDFEISNPRGRSRRRVIQPKVSPSVRGDIYSPSKSHSIKKIEEIDTSVSGVENANSEQVNTSKPGSTHLTEEKRDEHRVQSPTVRESEQAFADQMREAQQQVEKAKQETLAVSGPRRDLASAFTGPASQRSEALSKEAQSLKAGAASEPVKGSPELQQKVPPVIKLTGFFGEKPRATRSPPPSPPSEEPR